MIINIIRIGSSVKQISYNDKDIFLSRPHIKIPNTKVEKWGREYISFRNLNEDIVGSMMNNSDETCFWSVYGEIEEDKHGVKYLKIQGRVKLTRNPDYWITSFGAIDLEVDKYHSLFKIDYNSRSQIFSIAFNDDNPKMFECVAMLQHGDIIKVGNVERRFCVKTNPFLKVVLPF